MFCHSCQDPFVQGAAEERWGDATTDESDSEVTHYQSKRAEALEASGSVFVDASEEYGSLLGVKDRLEQWKQQQPGAYADAYMSLSVPAVLAPFVRLELLQWDPLFGGNAGQHEQLTFCSPQDVVKRHLYNRMPLVTKTHPGERDSKGFCLSPAQHAPPVKCRVTQLLLFIMHKR